LTEVYGSLSWYVGRGMSSSRSLSGVIVVGMVGYISPSVQLHVKAPWLQSCWEYAISRPMQAMNKAIP